MQPGVSTRRGARASKPRETFLPLYRSLQASGRGRFKKGGGRGRKWQRSIVGCCWREKCTSSIRGSGVKLEELERIIRVDPAMPPLHTPFPRTQKQTPPPVFRFCFQRSSSVLASLICSKVRARQPRPRFERRKSATKRHFRASVLARARLFY